MCRNSLFLDEKIASQSSQGKSHMTGVEPIDVLSIVLFLLCLPTIKLQKGLATTRWWLCLTIVPSVTAISSSLVEKLMNAKQLMVAVD
jgi:hypothetical protein